MSAITARQLRSFQERIDRLETALSTGFGVASLDELSAPKEGKIKMAKWTGTGVLPRYSPMKFDLIAHDGDVLVAQRVAKLPLLEYPEKDDDDKLICVTQMEAEQGDIVPVMIEGETLVRFKSRSDLTDINDDPNQVVKFGDALYIYYKDDTDAGKLINKTTDPDDASILQYISDGSVAFALETQQSNATLVRSLLRPRGVTGLNYFDNGVMVKSDDAASNFYHAVNWDVDLKVDNGTRWEVYLKFASPITSFDRLFICLEHIRSFINEPFYTESSFFGIEHRFDYDLIRVDLTPGETWGLDALTWNNANRATGTLFDTPANFLSGAQINFVHEYYETVLNWEPCEPPGMPATQETEVGGADGECDGIALEALAPETLAGIFFGIILYLGADNSAGDHSPDTVQSILPIRNTRTGQSHRSFAVSE